MAGDDQCADSGLLGRIGVRLAHSVPENEPLRTLPSQPWTIDDRYDLRALLGRGGMGEVWEAWDRKLERDVAVKLIRPDLLHRDPAAIERFQWEARATVRPTHDTFVVIHDVSTVKTGPRQGQPFIVMERLHGRTLRHVLLRDGKLSLTQTLDYLDRLLDGMAAAHAAGLVHCDLKPENVFVTTTGSIRILDLGLAALRDLSTNEQPSRRGRSSGHGAVGTPGYTPPEAFTGHAPDARFDVYALGVLLHEMLTAQRPLGTIVVEAQPLQHLLNGALHPDPNCRFETARHMREELSRARRYLGSGAVQGLPKTTGERIKAVSGGGALLLGLLVLLYAPHGFRPTLAILVGLLTGNSAPGSHRSVLR